MVEVTAALTQRPHTPTHPSHRAHASDHGLDKPSRVIGPPEKRKVASPTGTCRVVCPHYFAMINWTTAATAESAPPSAAIEASDFSGLIHSPRLSCRHLGGTTASFSFCHLCCWYEHPISRPRAFFLQKSLPRVRAPHQTGARKRKKTVVNAERTISPPGPKACVHHAVIRTTKSR